MHGYRRKRTAFFLLPKPVYIYIVVYILLGCQFFQLFYQFSYKIKIDFDANIGSNNTIYIYPELICSSITEGSKSVRSKIITLLLLRQNVEANPGPNKENIKQNLTLRTYNCNGLGDLNKFRRLLTKLRKEVQLGGIALLQETHIVDEKLITLYWKMNFVSSCVSTNRGGVITLYDNSFECVESYTDDEGRVAIVVIENEKLKAVVVNVYCPNDHKASYVFMEKVYDKIFEFLDKHPDAFVIMGGDLNACMAENDSLNRVKTKQESYLTDYIAANNSTCEIIDAYRSMEADGGYTWNRQQCYSRLDYLFVSNYLASKIIKVHNDWSYEQSDHASLHVEMYINEEIVMGPGLTRVNVSVLDDPYKLVVAKEEIKELLAQIPRDWDPHKRLEYLKVVIRSVLAGLVGRSRTELKQEIVELEESLNDMHNLKVKACALVDPVEKRRKSVLIDAAINRLDGDLRILRLKQSSETAFRARANWYEHGEKSNKYFLNLNKKYKKQKVIANIECDGVSFRGQEEVNKGITEFYQKLYKFKEVELDESDFYDNCPKLSHAAKEQMETELLDADLLAALKSCTDSSPGPDGIPYSIYKKLWCIAGSFILNSWKHSCNTGVLPASQGESVITLLPKEGKDVKDIKNWRPITLSNCDSKIITKALAIKMSTVLDDVINPNQTAYVRGRSVADNLRSILFMKEHCQREDLDAVLISLDARKAFDSVSHQYVEKILKHYGFGPQFIKCFKTLYSRISAKILINGHLSINIDIERGFKQGDALSCAFFILCVDPLIRNINADSAIRKVEIKSRLTKTEVNYKVGAFADDVDVVCKSDQASVQRVFEQYEKLTRRSGLELNADKTEILALHTGRSLTYNVSYNGHTFAISTVKELKICGIWYCNMAENEYKLNITEKIEKLSHKIKLWKSRNLTFEGKSLIVKTFGLSQLIYILQVYKLKDECAKKIERILFGFLWLSSRSENERGIDRIKRSILKNEFVEGGLNITDVECLNKSLKLRQFVRANKTCHPIRLIQRYCMEQIGFMSVLQQEYGRITNKEEVTRIAQITINNLCDFTRKSIISDLDNFRKDIKAIDFIASTNINSYLLRENKKLVQCVYIPLRNEGVERLHELCCEEETERERGKLKRIRMVIVNFPIEMIEIAASYDENVNEDSLGLTNILIKGEMWKELDKVTTKELQSTLKVALNKISNQDFNTRLGTIDYNKEFIGTFRRQCKNVKLRHIYFRLVSKDFFTMEKMFKYKMVNSDKCRRCGEVETYRHLLWDCRETKRVWQAYNAYLICIRKSNCKVLSYDDVFVIGDFGVVSKVKMKVVQEMIQIDRPVNWSIDNIFKIANELENIELYNSNIMHNLPAIGLK